MPAGTKNTVYGTYAFTDVHVSIIGPGGKFSIAGPDDANAEEAITIAWGEETNTQTIGADGSVMNSLHAARAATATIRLMKISPVNEQLADMFNHQRQSSALWGQNTISLRDAARGDTYSLLGCAFVRFPSNAYAKVGNMLEWEFHVSIADPLLGRGTLFHAN